MARLGLVCLILGGMLMLQAMGDDKPEGKPFEGNAQDVEMKGVADRPVSSLVESSVADESRKAEAPEARKTLRHGSSDKSLAGGGVIVGGLVTAIFAAVVCYIRVTRKGAHNDH